MGVGNDEGAQVLVRGRFGSGRAPADRIELGLRAFERGAGREPSEDAHAGPAARRVDGGVDPPRDPVAVIEREAIAFRHHADNRVGGGTELHDAADDVRIGAEAADPFVVADDDGVSGAGALVFRQQRASPEGVDARGAESRRRHLRHRDDLRRPPIDDKVALDGARHAEVFDGPRAAPRLEIEEVAGLTIGGRHVPAQERDQALALRERELRIHHQRDDGEGAGGDRDAHRHAQDADQAQTGIADEHAPREREVERGEHRAAPDPALAQPLGHAGADHVEARREGEGHAGPSRSLGKLTIEGVDHLRGIQIAMPAGKRAKRDPIEQRDHLGPPNMFWARAISRSARSRSDSARATARPKLVRW